MKLMTKANGETVQIHGAEAVRSMGLSTQMQILPIYHTSGSTRRIRIGNTTIRLQHASNDRLQHAKSKVGVALTALHYLGKEALSLEIISRIQKALTRDEFKTLRRAGCRVG
jgi:hypothetical protein